MAQPTRNFTVPPPDFGPELLRPADLFRSGASPPRVGPGIRFGPVSRFSPAARLRPAARLGPELLRPATARQAAATYSRTAATGSPPCRLADCRRNAPCRPATARQAAATYSRTAATGFTAPPQLGGRAPQRSLPLRVTWRTDAATLQITPPQPVFLPRRSLADGRRNAPCRSAAAYRAAGVSASAKALARRRSR